MKKEMEVRVGLSEEGRREFLEEDFGFLGEEGGDILVAVAAGVNGGWGAEEEEFTKPR